MVFDCWWEWINFFYSYKQEVKEEISFKDGKKVDCGTPDSVNKLTLTHGTTTNTTQNQSSTNTTDASISTTGSISAGTGRQQGHESSTITYAHDTKLTLGDLNGYAKETTLHGATITAQGGHYSTDLLSITTSQNHQTQRGSSKGGNIGVGTNSLSLGYNTQNSQSDITTNNVPSGILYVNTNNSTNHHDSQPNHSLTANHTTVTGGIIAAINVDEAGNQTNDKVNFTTNTLTTKDLLATEHSQHTGFGLAVGSSDNKPTSIGIQANHQGHDKQTLSLATIGQGATVIDTITHNNQTQTSTDISQTDINTDANATHKVIKDTHTGGLNINTTLDTRVFTKAGRQEIKREQGELDGNLEKIKEDIASDFKLAYDVASDTYKSIQVLKKIEEVRSQLTPEEQEYFDQYLLEFQQKEDLLQLNAAPAVAGGVAIGVTELTALAVGAGVAACSATEVCSEAVADGLKDAQKVAKEASGAVIDYTVGIFSSDDKQSENKADNAPLRLLRLPLHHRLNLHLRVIMKMKVLKSQKKLAVKLSIWMIDKLANWLEMHNGIRLI